MEVHFAFVQSQFALSALRRDTRGFVVSIPLFSQVAEIR
jgi:hypothetical protein